MYFLILGCSQNKRESEEDVIVSTEQSSSVDDYIQTISLDDIKNHVAALSSDQMAGRFSTTEGAKKAAAYLEQKLKDLKLKGIPGEEESYFQHFQMQKKKLVDCYLENENGRVKNWEGFGERFGHFSGEKEVEVIFVGYGHNSDLDGVDLNGKLAAFFIGGPDSSTLVGEKEGAKIKKASELGAIGSMMIFRDEAAKKNYGRFKRAFYGNSRYYLFKSPEEALNAERSMAIFPSAMAQLFGVKTEEFLSQIEELNSGKNISGRFKTRVTMKTSYEVYETLAGKNVLAFIEGTEKKDEWIILTAHYDHLGEYRGEIYNGADDNASGMAAVLEIAEAFTLAAENGFRVKRSILFLFTDAEEIGANGSTYYLENPAVPLTNTVVDVNLDAIGREDASRPLLKDFVYVYISKKAEGEIGLARESIEKRFENRIRVVTKSIPPGSDNYIFEMNDVPAIAYTTGHSRDYHKPSDTADKVHYDNLTAITQMIFATVWELADSDGSYLQ
jgi:hypothetical protein